MQNQAMDLLGFFRRNATPVPAAQPGSADEAGAMALVEKGNLLEDGGDPEGARRCYEEAIALAPRLARAHLNLGNALLASGQVAGALAAYRAALDLNPDYAAAHYNLGNAHGSLGQLQEAAASYRRALALKPDFTDAYVALGNVQEGLQLLEQAEASYRKALQLQPGYGQVHSNLGVVLVRQKRLEEAVQAFNSAAALNYESAVAHACLYAGQLCDWRGRAAAQRAVADMILRDVGDISPFLTLSMESLQGDAAMLQLRAGRRYAQDRLPKGAGPGQARPQPGGRLRIGYLSADFHDHATMHLLEGVLAGHDRERFAIHAYSYGPNADDVTKKAQHDCEHFTQLVDRSDLQAAEAIAADGIDILVDLKGFTEGARVEISALRPAPVLVSWLGYPGTLGHPQLADYLIGDPVVTPPEHAADFSETLALMPTCYQPNNRAKVIGANPGRRAAGLPASGFVFCSFNQSFKLNPDTFDVWCDLLREVPGSVLWLLAAPDPVAANLRREAEARHVDSSRLIFAGRQSLAEHLGRLQLADLALDTFPYNSHTTASDALWAGVPLVTLMDRTFASRVAASLLNAMGLPELVVHGWKDYFSLAKALALDPARLAAVRAKLAAARLTSPLFDTDRFTRDLERLYTRIWEQHRSGIRQTIVLPPEPAERIQAGP
jgi:predicted O-linked N-acetylglucosamine transferase (SPINDLY family)